MKNIVNVLGLLAIFSLSSCDALLKTAETVMKEIDQPVPLTSAEVAKGLKEALKVGTDTAVTRLTRENGYYLDQMVKIDLPPQTKEVLEYAKKVPGLDKMIEDVVIQINRSAEDAAKQAAPVFKSAITEMTIADAWGILNGAESAATVYLDGKTRNQLAGLYQPIMQSSLEKPLVAGVSAQQSWNEVSNKWNSFAGSFAGKLLEVKPINVDLGEYVTAKALDGLFVKVADQEKVIRSDVNARVSDLLKKVFEKQD